MISEAHAVRLLKKVLDDAEKKPGGVKAWAAAHQLHYSQVRDVRDGRRAMNDRVAAAIGLTRVHGWEEK